MAITTAMASMANMASTGMARSMGMDTGMGMGSEKSEEGRRPDSFSFRKKTMPDRNLIGKIHYLCSL